MLRLLRTSLASVCLLSCGLAQEHTEFDIVRFDPPAGWSVCKKDGGLVWTSPDKAIAFVMTKAQPLEGRLDAIADAVIEQLKNKPGFQLEGERQRGKHILTGGRWLNATFRYQDGNDFVYEWLALVGAGGRYVSLVTVTRSIEAYRREAPTIARCVDSINLTCSMVLESGRPPLTRYMLDETLDFLEWLMQTPLTDAQKATVETELRGYWQHRVEKEIEGMVSLLDGRQKLAAMKAEERELARQAVLEAAIKEWRHEQDSPAAKMMLGIYDCTHQPIAAGEPPLTRQAVEAFAEFLWFAGGQTAGCSSALAKETKDKLVTEVAAGYAKLPQEQREVIARMPLVWAAIRVQWRDLDEAGRRPLVENWRQNAQLVELGKHVREAAQHGLLQTQAQMQAEQAKYAIMSNIIQMQYETNRAIISNMGGGYHYEYRWR
jgi:hypothetical protein